MNEVVRELSALIVIFIIAGSISWLITKNTVLADCVRCVTVSAQTCVACIRSRW